MPQAPLSAPSCRPAARRPGAPSALTPSQSWAPSNPTAGSGSTGQVGAPADLKGEAARGPVGAGPWPPTPGGCLLGAGLSWPWNDGEGRFGGRSRFCQPPAPSRPAPGGGDGSVPAPWWSYLFWLILECYRFLVFPLNDLTPLPTPPRQVIPKLLF